MAPLRALTASFLLAASQLSSASKTTSPGEAEDMQDGCVHMQIVHSTNEEVLGRRAVEFNLANRSDVAYYAKLDLGTPSQPQYVQLDTGSFELWVNPSCDGLTQADTLFCQAVGRYDGNRSSTAVSLGTTKTLRYGIGTANVTYVRDNIALPGTSAILQQVQFGVATDTDDAFSGILGIGYGQNVTTRYPNFVDELQKQGITRAKAYSIALGLKDDQAGVIVFGGVDTSKFTGALAKLPVIPAAQSPDKVPRFWVQLQSLGIARNNAGPTGTPVVTTYPNSTMAVFLDSGSTLTLMPEPLVAAVAASMGGAKGASASGGFYTVDCNLAGVNGSLEFAFQGMTIHVPFREVIRRSNTGCVLGIQPHPNFVLLGDTFMRSAYVVFDLENHLVYLAPYSNCGSTPAALASASVLATLRGSCAPQQILGGVTSSSSSNQGKVDTAPSPSAQNPAAPAATTAGRTASGAKRSADSRWKRELGLAVLGCWALCAAATAAS